MKETGREKKISNGGISLGCFNQSAAGNSNCNGELTLIYKPHKKSRCNHGWKLRFLHTECAFQLICINVQFQLIIKRENGDCKLN